METKEFTLRLQLEDGYRFSVDFGQALPHLVMDEPEPLGRGEGPNAARVLAAAIGNCLGASLLFCLQRSKVEVNGLGVEVAGTLARNEKGRLRVAVVRVRLAPGIAAGDRERIERCLGIFEDYCIVTQSVRQGIDVQVEVAPAEMAAADSPLPI